MNSLEQYLQYKKIDPIKAMNALQEYRIISDNCIDAKDVYETGIAITWLEQNFYNL